LDSVPGWLPAAGVHTRVELAACGYLDAAQIPRAGTYLASLGAKPVLTEANGLLAQATAVTV
jgi:hypothetical protein